MINNSNSRSILDSTNISTASATTTGIGEVASSGSLTNSKSYNKYNAPSSTGGIRFYDLNRGSPLIPQETTSEPPSSNNSNSTTSQVFFESISSEYYEEENNRMMYNNTLSPPPNGTHAVAYSPIAKTGKERMMFYVRVYSRAVIATTFFLFFVLIISLDKVQDNVRSTDITHHMVLRGTKNYKYWGGAVEKGYFLTSDAMKEANNFRFAAVTDLDQLSAVDGTESKPKFKSYLLPGNLKYDPDAKAYSVTFHEPRTLLSGHNEAGRGMELSELTLYQNRLLSFDDRTGSVFELLSQNGGKETIVVPRMIFTEGEGNTDKGMKWEWATVKDNNLYLGSMGKEYTNPDGSVANRNNLWIAIINSRGEVKRKDWSDNYNFVRSKLGASPPGYFINEAILWSDALKSWVFIPRRISSEMYDEVKDERMGATKVAIVNENFTQANIVDIKFKNHDPLHGFSTAAFVPGTKDRHVLAIRTVEEDCVGGDESVCKQRTYFCVFDVLTGDVLMDEVEFKDHGKFEGVEFANIYAPEPTKSD